MTCAAFSEGDTVIHRLDPRTRIVAAVSFAALAAVCRDPSVCAAALAMGLALVFLARLPLRPTLKRLAVVNGFLLMLVLVLPWTVPGEPLFVLAGGAYSTEGLAQSVRMAIRANAIVLALTALLGTTHLVSLGHAMGRLGVPQKMVHLFFFTVRYNDLLHHEYESLRQAMRVRCFRPRFGLHTFGALGHLAGMLLVRSFDRSVRILAAMRCRGFTGAFHTVDQLTFRRRDVVFAIVAACALTTLACLEWTWTA